MQAARCNIVATTHCDISSKPPSFLAAVACFCSAFQSLDDREALTRCQASCSCEFQIWPSDCDAAGSREGKKQVPSHSHMHGEPVDLPEARGHTFVKTCWEILHCSSACRPIISLQITLHTPQLHHLQKVKALRQTHSQTISHPVANYDDAIQTDDNGGSRCFCGCLSGMTSNHA